MATYSSILAWKYHGQKSLADYGPWACRGVRHNLVTKQQHIYMYYRHRWCQVPLSVEFSNNISNVLSIHEKGGFLPSGTTLVNLELCSGDCQTETSTV